MDELLPPLFQTPPGFLLSRATAATMSAGAEPIVAAGAAFIVAAALAAASLNLRARSAD